MKIDEKLLDAYYQGRCTEEERLAVEAWVGDEYDGYDVEPPATLGKKIWKRISPRTIPTFDKLIYWSAAACMLLAMGSILIFGSTEKKAQEISMNHFEAPMGKRSQVVLPDGSIVHLNSGSTLSFPDKFSSVRKVELLGEAFFDVRKMPDKPFVILTKTMQTKVLGTSFNLLERDGNRVLTVLTGKVAYQNIKSGNTINVLPGEQVELAKDNSFIKRRVYAQKFAAWKDGKLLFENQQMGEVASTLSAWYGTKVVITDQALAKKRFTGQFDNPSLNAILASMGFALKFTYKFSADSYQLYPERENK